MTDKQVYHHPVGFSEHLVDRNEKTSPAFCNTCLQLAPHEHNFTLILGPDGHGMIYGKYEGYVRSCKACGEYAPDFVEFQERRKAERLAEARQLVAEADNA